MRVAYLNHCNYLEYVMQWFDVDKQGLAKLLERKGKSFVMFELIQNALDENTTAIDVSLLRAPGTRYAILSVRDDSPEGFKDLSHAFTLFAESDKKGDINRRGRFNLGEKLVLALADEATIKSTKGSIIFDGSGRRKTNAKTKVGSIFMARMKMTTQEIEECTLAVGQLIVPAAVTLTYNGQQVASRMPVAQLENIPLQTEISNDEGSLKRVTRAARIEIYEPNAGEQATLFEMGIPVMPTGDRYHVNVCQKIPLSFDRDSVPGAYLTKIRSLVLDAMALTLNVEDANATWVRDAVEHHGNAMGQSTMMHLTTLRFGEKRVSYDPSDKEANNLAVASGYQVVYGSQLSKSEWEAVRRAGAVLPAGQVTPSPKPFSEDGSPLKVLAERDWTPAIRAVVDYAMRIGHKLLGLGIKVSIANDITWPFAGTYGEGHLRLNLGRLGHRWFDSGNLVPVNDLLLHEFGHHYCSNHLDQDYYKALTRLGAQLTQLALTEPELFQLTELQPS
jgi:hypothetical protein